MSFRQIGSPPGEVLPALYELVSSHDHAQTLEEADLNGEEETEKVRGKVKRASQKGPVIITDRGKPAQVLLSFEEYKRLTNQRRNIAAALAMPQAVDIELELPKSEITSKPVDLI